jgi:hypothetical protein
MERDDAPAHGVGCRDVDGNRAASSHAAASRSAASAGSSARFTRSAGAAAAPARTGPAAAGHSKFFSESPDAFVPSAPQMP